MFRFKRTQNQPFNDSDQKESKIKELREALGPLSGRSLKYCTEQCLKRYLKARNWDVQKAKKMLEETLKWRANYKPEEIRWSDVAHEGETGKLSRANFHDKLDRPVLIIRPGMQNTNSAEGNVKHLIYLMENTILNLPEEQEQISCLVDFTGYSAKTQISLKASRDIMYILQSHYPCRLEATFFYNPPGVIQVFYKALGYFMDPTTTENVKFVYPKDEKSVELMKTFFDIENLPEEFGGKSTLKYDHEEFSQLMTQDDVKTADFWRVS